MTLINKIAPHPVHMCFGMLLDDGANIELYNPYGSVWFMEYQKQDRFMLLQVLYCPFCGVELRTLQ